MISLGVNFESMMSLLALQSLIGNRRPKKTPVSRKNPLFAYGLSPWHQDCYTVSPVPDLYRVSVHSN